jgi:hypothetical protein
MLMGIASGTAATLVLSKVAIATRTEERGSRVSSCHVAHAAAPVWATDPASYLLTTTTTITTTTYVQRSASAFQRRNIITSAPIYAALPRRTDGCLISEVIGVGKVISATATQRCGSSRYPGGREVSIRVLPPTRAAQRI